MTRATGSDSVVHAFETEEGKLRLVAWLQTASPRVAGLSQPQDPRKETITVTVPAAGARSAVLFDHLGRRLSERRLQPWGTSGALQLQLVPGQVVVAEVAPPRRPS